MGLLPINHKCIVFFTTALIFKFCVCGTKALASPDTLGKKSTALDVLKVLNKTSRLAPYLTPTQDSPSSEKVGGTGGVAIVTGGNAGIGAVSVETLALAGMNVVLCARNTDAGEKVKSSLPAWCQPHVRVQKIDLSDLDSVKTAADEITKELKNVGDGNKKIDVLLNNAGVMATKKRESTKQGFELQFGTNHVGHHMFTRLLLPHINKGGRVVTVASTAHTMGELDVSNLNFETKPGMPDRRYSPWGAYGQSKLSNILFAKGLNDELKKAGSDILSVSLHPGVIVTNLWQNVPFIFRSLARVVVSDKNVEQGAATNVYCSIVQPDGLEGGEFYDDCKVSKPNEAGQDVSGSLRKQLWQATEDLIKEKGYKLPDSLLG